MKYWLLAIIIGLSFAFQFAVADPMDPKTCSTWNGEDWDTYLSKNC